MILKLKSLRLIPGLVYNRKINFPSVLACLPAQIFFKFDFLPYLLLQSLMTLLHFLKIKYHRYNNMNDNLAYYVLLSKVKGIGPVKFNQILERNKRQKISLKEFFEFFAKKLSLQYSFIQKNSREMIVDSIHNLDEEKRLVEKLNKKNIHVVTIEDDVYPEILKNSLGLLAPPILYLYGNISLLANKAFGIVGTRNPSNTGCQITRLAAEVFSSYQFDIVSGYAEGTDEIAHNAALKKGGNTIAVLGCGIFHFSDNRLFNNTNDNTLILSEFYPTFLWHRGFLMTRNKTICSLAKGILVSEAHETGGAYHSGNFGLMLKKNVFTVSFPDDAPQHSGNAKLISQGVHEIPFLSIDNLTKQFNDIAENLIATKNQIYQKPDQYMLFDDVCEELKQYSKKEFPILSLDNLINRKKLK